MKPPSGVVPCALWHLLVLCDDMRPDEQEQLLRLTGTQEYNAETAAIGFFNTPGPKFTLIDLKTNRPILAGGYEEVLPGVWQSWMTGTEEGWKTHWMSITKGTLWAMDELIKGGARRLQTMVLSKRSDAIGWYVNFLKMRPEGEWENYTTTGESVRWFARLGAH